MIHLALLVFAVIFLGGVALSILGVLLTLVGSGFQQNKGCGCGALVFSLVVVVVIAFALLLYFS
jgi:hypothetical protein